ncbi:hypothetical protein [Nocardia sp. NPDC057030]|uniref:hypothetical protein n=1 Tax=unclassified Nocardia TaxID=2637762 RepID=UPI00364478D5
MRGHLPRELDSIATVVRVGDVDEVGERPRSGQLPRGGAAEPGRSRSGDLRQLGRSEPAQIRRPQLVPHAEQAFAYKRYDVHGAIALADRGHEAAEGAWSVVHIDIAVGTRGLKYGPEATCVDQVLVRRFPHAVQVTRAAASIHPQSQTKLRTEEMPSN